MTVSHLLYFERIQSVGSSWHLSAESQLVLLAEITIDFPVVSRVGLGGIVGRHPVVNRWQTQISCHLWFRNILAGGHIGATVPRHCRSEDRSLYLHTLFLEDIFQLLLQIHLKKHQIFLCESLLLNELVKLLVGDDLQPD